MQGQYVADFLFNILRRHAFERGIAEMDEADAHCRGDARDLERLHEPGDDEACGCCEDRGYCDLRKDIERQAVDVVPMFLRLFVINRMNSSSGGVENPCTMPE